MPLSFLSISKSLDKAIIPRDFDPCKELVQDIPLRCAGFDSINDLREPLLDLLATDLDDYAFADLLCDPLEYREVLNDLASRELRVADLLEDVAGQGLEDETQLRAVGVLGELHLLPLVSLQAQQFSPVEVVGGRGLCEGRDLRGGKEEEGEVAAKDRQMLVTGGEGAKLVKVVVEQVLRGLEIQVRFREKRQDLVVLIVIQHA